MVGAVFDWVIADIAATTQAAVAAAPPDEQSRAGMANIVRTIADDARIGRLLFSAHLANPVLVRKRVESGALFASLSGQHAGACWACRRTTASRPTSHFVVGGVVQTISAWLAGEVGLSPTNSSISWRRLSIELGEPELSRELGGHAGRRRSASVFGSVTVSLSVNSLVQQANSSVMPSGSWK